MLGANSHSNIFYQTLQANRIRGEEIMETDAFHFSKQAERETQKCRHVIILFLKDSGQEPGTGGPVVQLPTGTLGLWSVTSPNK